MSQLALHLLGPPRLERDGVPLEFDTRKIIALVAYLAVTGGPHTRESLITLLWPELEPSRARAVLRRNLSLLRKALDGEWLIVDGETISLDPDTDAWVDVDQFRSLLQVCREHDHPEADTCSDCLAALTEAVELYQGDFLAGFTLRDSVNFDEFQFFQTEELRRELASALERLVRGHSSQGEYEAAVQYARRWLALDPLHEPAHRCLMELYSQAGQRSAALRQYDECVRIMEEELGLVPAQETTSLYEQIRTGSVEGGRPLTTPVRPRHNLPAQATPFIGREVELAAIETRLRDPDCRLLTLVGPGGSGKTRLALEAAATQLDNFEHGVFFVSLAPLQSVDGIVPAVTQALGFPDRSEGTPQQQLLDYLRNKVVLLILDNFEHLLDGLELVDEILQVAPGTKFVTTSRTSLKMACEHLFPVAGMDFPSLSSMEVGSGTIGERRHDALELFLNSAQRIRPDFELGEDALADVAQICHLVEGMPLAIVLATVWIKMLTPAEIAAEISKSLDFLGAELRDLPPRQRSVRAVFDHSWRLLSREEQRVLQALSVFRSGFIREAAQQVAGASLHDLMNLVDKSLLQRNPGGRYEIHELVRQYGEERLERSPAAREAAHDRHCAYYANALEQWAADLKGPRQSIAVREMDAEIENARAAWDWAVKQEQVQRLGQALEGLCLYYQRRERHQEGETACREAVAYLATVTSSEGLRVVASALRWQSDFNYPLNRDELGHQLARQSLDVLEQLNLTGQDVRAEQAEALLSLGWRISALAVGRGMFDAEREGIGRLWEQSLELYQALGDQTGEAQVLASMGNLAELSGAFDAARQLHQDSLVLRREAGDWLGVASSLIDLGTVSWVVGQLEEGERLYQESLAIYQEMDDQPAIALGLLNLGAVLMRQGRFAEGYAMLEEALTIRENMVHIFESMTIYLFLGEAKAHLGEYDEAHTWAEVGLAHINNLHHVWNDAFAHFVLGVVALGKETYVEAQELLQDSVSRFRRMSFPENLGWALAASAYAARGLDQLPEARKHLSEALRVYRDTGAFFALLYGLPAAALLLVDQGEVERAVELYALASRYPFVANSRWFEDIAGQHIAAVAATLPSDVVAAAQERGRARDLDATVAELLEELEGYRWRLYNVTHDRLDPPTE